MNLNAEAVIRRTAEETVDGAITIAKQWAQDLVDLAKTKTDELTEITATLKKAVRLVSELRATYLVDGNLFRIWYRKDFVDLDGDDGEGNQVVYRFNRVPKFESNNLTQEELLAMGAQLII